MRIKASRCPKCGTLLDAATCVEGGKHKHYPRPDDFSICVRCAAVCRYDRDLALRICTLAELNELEPLQLVTIAKAQELIRKRALEGN